MTREMKGGRTRKHRDTRKHRKTRKQNGGYVGMPLAYFKDGAQMVGTSADPTGLGLATSTDAWVRTPLAQTGGGCCNPMPPQLQQGGFPPSIMGSLATNGVKLLPVAGYMGYQMWENSRKTHSRRRRRRHTSRV